MDKNIARKVEMFQTDFKKSGSKFCDQEFNATAKSIGDVPKLRGIKVQWLRPEEIFCKDKSKPWTVCENISPTSIAQGCLGDCWFLSSIAVVASKPELIQKLILTPDWSPAGIYALRLCKDGVWTNVIVDDLLPCDGQKRLLFARANDKQLWVCLLEKALAKLHGSYDALISGNAVEGFVTLTGFPAERIDLVKDENNRNPDLTWQTLLSCCKAGFLIGIACGGRGITEKEYENVGLIPDHMYSVLQVRSINKLRLIQLRNPWGNHSWKGDWNFASCLWTPELMEKLKASKEDDGTFWISFQDILKYFDQADICQIRPTWPESRYVGNFSNSDSKAIPYYKIKIATPTEIEYALYQTSSRLTTGKKDSPADICMILVSLTIPVVPEKSTPKIKRYVGSSPRSNKSSVIGKLRESILQPGTYALIPFSILSLTTRAMDKKYALAIHSSVGIEVENTEAPLEFLADCLITFATKSGNETKWSEHISLHNKSKWTGNLFVAENKHTSKYLRLSTDFSQSKNLLSSRAGQPSDKSDGMKLWDVIPPGYCQVLMILTRSVDSLCSMSTYSASYALANENVLGDFGPANEAPAGQGLSHVPYLESLLHMPRRFAV